MIFFFFFFRFCLTYYWNRFRNRSLASSCRFKFIFNLIGSLIDLFDRPIGFFLSSVLFRSSRCLDRDEWNNSMCKVNCLLIKPKKKMRSQREKRERSIICIWYERWNQFDRTRSLSLLSLHFAIFDSRSSADYTETLCSLFSSASLLHSTHLFFPLLRAYIHNFIWARR